MLTNLRGESNTQGKHNVVGYEARGESNAQGKTSDHNEDTRPGVRVMHKVKQVTTMQWWEHKKTKLDDTSDNLSYQMSKIKGLVSCD